MRVWTLDYYDPAELWEGAGVSGSTPAVDPVRVVAVDDVRDWLLKKAGTVPVSVVAAFEEEAGASPLEGSRRPQEASNE